MSMPWNFMPMRNLIQCSEKKACEKKKKRYYQTGTTCIYFFRLRCSLQKSMKKTFSIIILVDYIDPVKLSACTTTMAHSASVQVRMHRHGFEFISVTQ